MWPHLPFKFLTATFFIITENFLTSSKRCNVFEFPIKMGSQKKCTWINLSKDSLTGQVDDMQVSLQSSDPNVVIPQPLVTIRVNYTMASHLNTGKIEVNNTMASHLNTGNTTTSKSKNNSEHENKILAGNWLNKQFLYLLLV